MNIRSDRSFAHRVRQASPFIILLTVSAVLTSCSVQESKKSAEQAVVTFRAQMDSERYEDIYAQADDGFRKNQSKAEIVSFLEAVHRKLGKVVTSSSRGFGVNTAFGSGTNVALSYQTTFEGGKGTEDFVWHIASGKAHLFHYNITSLELVTK